MKILLCPDKFKNSFSSRDLCELLSDCFLQASSKFEISQQALADGGDGSLDIIKRQLDLSEQKVATCDALDRPIDSSYWFSNEAAYIEMASASGLAPLSFTERSPLKTSTKGTGLMIKDAIEKGFTKIHLFVGGSASNDAGIGIAHALGFQFLDKESQVLHPSGENLLKIDRIEIGQAMDLAKVQIQILTDVNNVMHGPNGAAYNYAAQKGANQSEVVLLDKGLQHFDTILKDQFEKDISAQTGMGAAGAVAAALVGLMDAKIQNGFDMIAKLTDLECKIKQADLVITGEGRVDQSSFDGKVVGQVFSLCQKHHIPCGLIAGSIDEGIKLPFLFQKSIISKAKNLEDALEHSNKYVAEIVEEITQSL